MMGYLSIFKICIKALLQYRVAIFASIGTQLFFGFINMMIFQAFYGQKAPQASLSLSQAITL